MGNESNAPASAQGASARFVKANKEKNKTISRCTAIESIIKRYLAEPANNNNNNDYKITQNNKEATVRFDGERSSITRHRVPRVWLASNCLTNENSSGKGCSLRARTVA